MATFTQSLTLAWLLCAAGGAFASGPQKPPAERSGMDPAARNKVGNVMARSQIEESGARAVVDKYTNSTGMGAGASGGCVTNIGAPPAPTGTNAIGNRYGAGKKTDQIIVVKGPVVNVCK